MILEVKKFFVCENREAVFQIEYDKRDHDFITRRPWSIIRGYACTKVGGTPRSMHRLIMKVDDHRIIHHLDGNKLNNRRSNLVICNSAKEHKAYHKKQLGGSEMNCKCSKCGHEWIKRTESDPKMCPSCKSRLWKSRANGAKGGRPVKRVQLINPWSGALPEDKNLAWDEIRAWAQGHVHPDDLPGWLRRARQAFRDNDGAALGTMIIGS